jgi:hypothetical protein
MENRHHLEARKMALWKELLPSFKPKPDDIKQNDKILLWVFVSTTVALAVLLLLLVLYLVRPKMVTLKLSHCRKKDKKLNQENNSNSEYRAVAVQT